MTVLEARDLLVDYGGHPVLHNVAFRATAGEITIVAGPNGSGKSTLIKAISKETAHGGTVFINGFDTHSIKTWQLATMRAVLPQETTIAFPYSVAEVIKFGIDAGATDRNVRATELIEKALGKVGLEGFHNRFMTELSGGERQRVHLARVLCQIWEPVGDEGPRWLILDEPVASLDIRHQIDLMELARDYARRGGGVIAVMHDLNLSAIYGDRLFLMKDGCVVDEGSPSTVLTASTLVRVFECRLRPNFAPATGTFILPQSASEAD